MASSPKFSHLPIERLLEAPRAIAAGVPEGFDALLLGELARGAASRAMPILHVARDGNRLATLEEALSFFAPDVEVLSFPAWDGVPYDRVAPNAETIAQRIATLAALASRGTSSRRRASSFSPATSSACKS
jgi:transcription-repair coupling factor (superfamily II helicase)